MIRSTILTLAALLPLISAGTAQATAPPAINEAQAATDPAITPPMAAPPDANPVASAVRSKLNALPTDGSAQELKERAVLSDFYAARRDAPVWLSEAGLTDNGAALGAEILKANDYGLEAKDFELPAIPPASQLDAEKIGKADVEISLALLKYARYARGGRIIDPAILLNSNLDRKPQLIDPEIVIKDAADAPDAAAYVRGLHPKQPQFEKLRQAYLANKGKPLARKIRQHPLKLAERPGRLKCLTLRLHFIEGPGCFNEPVGTPVLAFLIHMPHASLVRRHQLQHALVCIGQPIELGAYMRCHAPDVLHHRNWILEDLRMLDAACDQYAIENNRTSEIDASSKTFNPQPWRLKWMTSAEQGAPADAGVSPVSTSPQ